MKYIFLTLALAASSITFGQELKLSDEELRIKLDSVVAEGNLLYKYERSAWVSTDLANADKNVKDNFGGYLTYQTKGGFKTIILDKDRKTCIAEYVYTDNFEAPDLTSAQKRNLNSTEKKLIGVRHKLITNAIDSEYGLGAPEGYSLNFVLIPANKEYKLYVLTGTTLSDIIPFGNDYLFYADKKGKITGWQKFHSILIPTQTTAFNGKKVTSTGHSHLPTTPLITATDICTFMLYAPMYGHEEFDVYSPALKTSFKYNLKTNRITIDKRN